MLGNHCAGTKLPF